MNNDDDIIISLNLDKLGGNEVNSSNCNKESDETRRAYPEIRQGEFKSFGGKNKTHVVTRDPVGDSRMKILRGRKKCAVFVHGLGFCNQSWEGFEDVLTERGFTTVSYDLIGRGLSDASTGYGLKDHVDQLYNICLELVDEFDDIDVIGHSLGGAIVIGFGADHSDNEKMKSKIKSIQAIAPAGLMSVPGLCIIQNMPILNLILYPFLMNLSAQRQAWSADHVDTESPACKDIVSLQEALHADPERSGKITYAIWRCLEDFPLSNLSVHIETLARKMKEKEERNVLLGKEAPVALKVKVIWGTADTVCPYSNASRWQEAFKNVFNFQLVTLEDRGHSVVQCDLDALVKATDIIPGQ